MNPSDIFPGLDAADLLQPAIELVQGDILTDRDDGIPQASDLLDRRLGLLDALAGTFLVHEGKQGNRILYDEILYDDMRRPGTIEARDIDFGPVGAPGISILSGSLC
jgi:hypothetical protein